MSIIVRKAGMLTTIQDSGRAGYQKFGVSVGGAMDEVALRTANALVGNEPAAAALEVTLLGPVLEFTADHRFAIGGADLSATLDGRTIEPYVAYGATAGSRLAFGERRSGCRAYVAIAGGIDVPVVLGGRGTDLTGRFGGIEGRALRQGDMLECGTGSDAARVVVDASLRTTLPRDAWPTIRVVPGVEYELLSAESRESLVGATFRVSPTSNRMGFRLDGASLTLAEPIEMISSPVALGTIQLPPGGQPIVLMADRQTTGGYPRIASVITADVPLVAQLAPGDRLSLRMVALDEARSALREQRRLLNELERAARARGAGGRA